MIVVTGLSHHTAPIAVREKVALTADDTRELLRSLGASEHISEVFVVSTCNRVEIVARSAEDTDHSSNACAQVCSAAIVGRSSQAEASIYTHRGPSAVKHLVRVASSLDSLVVGEAQILGQMKQGFEAARSASTVGSSLHQLFVTATRGAKKIRSETTIGVGQVSVPSIAIELASQIFGELRGRRVVLVGSGEMGQTVARLLHDAGTELVVVGRTEERVAALSERVGGQARTLEDLPEVLKNADVVVSSTSAPHPVIRREHLTERLKSRRAGNLFLIDLAVPRDVEPEIGKLDGVFLYDVDDLSEVAARSSGNRQAAAAEAEKIVESVVEDWGKRSQAEQATPTIKALRARLRLDLEEELSRSLKGKLRGLGEEERGAIAKMLDAGINRILHEPVTRLREKAASSASEAELAQDDLASTLNELFDLSDVPDEALDISSVQVPGRDSAPPSGSQATTQSEEEAVGSDSNTQAVAPRTGSDPADSQ